MEPEIPAIPTPPPQPVAPPVPPVFPKKNNLAVILLSVFLLVTLLISGYLFLQVQSLTKQLAQLQVQPTPTPQSTEIPSPTLDPTANWKTFVNTTFKYLLKYPQTWLVSAKGNVDPTTFDMPIFESKCNYEKGELCQQIYVEATRNSDPADLNPTFVKNDDIVTNTQNLKIDGETAKIFEHFQTNYQGVPGIFRYVILTNHAGYRYTILYLESKKGKEFKTGSDLENKIIFDQILSTFKFIN